MLKLVEDRARIDAFLDKILTLHTAESAKKQPFICTGAAIQAAKHLIEEDGKYSHCKHNFLLLHRWKNLGLFIKYKHRWCRCSIMQRRHKVI